MKCGASKREKHSTPGEVLKQDSALAACCISIACDTDVKKTFISEVTGIKAYYKPSPLAVWTIQNNVLHWYKKVK